MLDKIGEFCRNRDLKFADHVTDFLRLTKFSYFFHIIYTLTDSLNYDEIEILLETFIEEYTAEVTEESHVITCHGFTELKKCLKGDAWLNSRLHKAALIMHSAHPFLSDHERSEAEDAVMLSDFDYLILMLGISDDSRRPIKIDRFKPLIKRSLKSIEKTKAMLSACNKESYHSLQIAIGSIVRHGKKISISTEHLIDLKKILDDNPSLSHCRDLDLLKYFDTGVLSPYDFKQLVDNGLYNILHDTIYRIDYESIFKSCEHLDFITSECESYAAGKLVHFHCQRNFEIDLDRSRPNTIRTVITKLQEEGVARYMIARIMLKSSPQSPESRINENITLLKQLVQGEYLTLSIAEQRAFIREMDVFELGLYDSESSLSSLLGLFDPSLIPDLFHKVTEPLSKKHAPRHIIVWYFRSYLGYKSDTQALDSYNKSRPKLDSRIIVQIDFKILFKHMTEELALRVYRAIPDEIQSPIASNNHYSPIKGREDLITLLKALTDKPKLAAAIYTDCAHRSADVTHDLDQLSGDEFASLKIEILRATAKPDSQIATYLVNTHGTDCLPIIKSLILSTHTSYETISDTLNRLKPESRDSFLSWLDEENEQQADLALGSVLTRAHVQLYHLKFHGHVNRNTASHQTASAIRARADIYKRLLMQPHRLPRDENGRFIDNPLDVKLNHLLHSFRSIPDTATHDAVFRVVTLLYKGDKRAFETQIRQQLYDPKSDLYQALNHHTGAGVTLFNRAGPISLKTRPLIAAQKIISDRTVYDGERSFMI